DTQVLSIEPFSFLKQYYQNVDFKKYKQISSEVGIGFVDGFIGYIGYDMVEVFEPVLRPYMSHLIDETNIPDFYMIRPKIIFGYSHKSTMATFLVNDEEYYDEVDKIDSIINSTYTHIPLSRATLLSQPKFVFDEEKFKQMVLDAKKMIRSGDIFQIVLSNRLKIQVRLDDFSFYRKLRSKNPSPYLYFLKFDDFSIIGSSPEVMVRLTDGVILLRPIAGTRKRGNTLKRDLELEHEMINDEKEVAEHIMLVDLGRNDVGRVAKAGSVKVEELMRVERYSHVMHMVSDVVGELDEKYDMFDLFKATFTAGTMTGSPKIRAMELIAQYEGIKRGYYAGSIGYFGFDGNMDSAITIRTALKKGDEIIFQAGAGVVADSKPELEFLEVKNKLKALMATLEELSNG
ncbi:MAG: anthranilate synthase component I family protein, partial [Epsilonproteobacteria bacterium]|nr:anthranilate synthase component I family protein [Campylobacterota bacterium]